ncbi:AAA family ATPase [Flammeovirga kamogawensis]|uniref:AAA family ATPase n=1 Tax=Flammeovirga kamogawensis TaxID=373891 RepID=A0ABX8H363_9BACT|nr:AAA family ATPase [Flammeovirga kamogawensis]MBB6460334.1 putative ATPase [Flammeovirga kamogawensis]QWG10143.1 AAA family ATPase [Flammeovirga kamogawensis]TRX65651.1 AAA family ATPase [Flammeovirga kamogawensis]
MQKFIISGAAGTGKTTLINAIAQKNIPSLPEVSRKVIQQEQRINSDGFPWANIEKYTDLVFHESVQNLFENTDAIFCDRSLIDAIAYLNHQGKPIPSKLAAFPFKEHYHKKVFFAMPWKDIYRTDNQRPESFEYHLSLSKVLFSTYNRYGFDLIQIPFGSVHARVKFVLNNVCL